MPILLLDSRSVLKAIGQRELIATQGTPWRRGHPDTEAESSAEIRWGHRWIFEPTPECPDATVVTEIYGCSRAPEDERVAMGNGNIWVESMTRTLERLDQLCARQPGSGRG